MQPIGKFALHICLGGSFDGGGGHIQGAIDAQIEIRAKLAATTGTQKGNQTTDSFFSVALLYLSFYHVGNVALSLALAHMWHCTNSKSLCIQVYDKCLNCMCNKLMDETYVCSHQKTMDPSGAW